MWLVLLENAERALPEIRAGFGRLSYGLERLHQHGAEVLTVTASAGRT